MQLTRRHFFTSLGAATAVTAAVATPGLSAMGNNRETPQLTPTQNKPVAPGAVQWFCTTQQAAWQQRQAPACAPLGKGLFSYQFDVQVDKPQQTMEGFGGAFSEKGWQALSQLDGKLQKAVLELLFDPQLGANFNLCRTPIAANDFSRKWYSYAETDGDFELRHFSIDNDRETLIPFIKAAQKIRPDLAVWASPWSPPSWMKKNKHYAMAPAWPGTDDNGIRPDQVGREGEDFFILEEQYLRSYANYFKRYVEAYGAEGIGISAVMPQNEFNSAQPFPSCCWTPAGLNQFIPLLGQTLAPLKVEVLLGTLERGNIALVNDIFNHPPSAAVLTGLGIQWAGKGALPLTHHHYPTLRVWGTEQECGTGTNDWHYAKYAWNLIKHYLTNGATVYQYWNMILSTHVLSTWGWPQNSLVTVDTEKNRFWLNPEYYVMRHLSSAVQKGAKFIPAASFTGYENQLAFLNPDGSVVIVIQNEMAEEMSVTAKIGNKQLTLKLPGDSYNTVVIPAQQYR